MVERLGPYVLEERIGAGGMGQVWRARDTEHGDRVVALKMLPPGLAADDAFQERFRRESLVASRLRSPHVVPIHRFGELEGRLFIDMQLVDGVDLSDAITRGGPMAAGRAVGIVGQIAAALDLAHQEGLVHRDVKPSNVRLVRAASGGDHAYLLDFGIATVLGAGTSATGAGEIVGSLQYMAPERFGGGAVDHRADIYALAGLLYACLTGRPPFAVSDLPEAMQAHLRYPPPAVSASRPDLPPELDAVVATGMAKDPGLRFGEAGDLARAAHRVLGAATRVDPTRVGPNPWQAPGRSGVLTGPSDEHPPRRPTTRRWWWGAGVGVALAALLVAGAVVWGTGRDVVEPPAPAPVALVQPGQTITVPTGRFPTGATTSPDGRFVYVANYGSGTISVLDGATNQLVSSIPVGGSPNDIAITPNGRYAYVSDADRGVVTVVALGNNAIVASIAAPDQPFAVAADPDGSRVFVANEKTDTVSVSYWPEAGGPTWLKGTGAAGLVVSPDGDVLYAPNREQNSVTVLDTSSGETTATVPVGAFPVAGVVSPDGGTLYVANRDGDSVSVVDTASASVEATIPIAGSPFGIDVSPDGGRLYVGGYESSTVSVIDTSTNAVVDDFRAGSTTLTFVHISPDGRRAYVSDYTAGTMLIIGLG